MDTSWPHRAIRHRCSSARIGGRFGKRRGCSTLQHAREDVARSRSASYQVTTLEMDETNRGGHRPAAARSKPRKAQGRRSSRRRDPQRWHRNRRLPRQRPAQQRRRPYQRGCRRSSAGSGCGQRGNHRHGGRSLKTSNVTDRETRSVCESGKQGAASGPPPFDADGTAPSTQNLQLVSWRLSSCFKTSSRSSAAFSAAIRSRLSRWCLPGSSGPTEPSASGTRR